MDAKQKAQIQKNGRQVNFLENLNEIGKDVVQSFKEDLVKKTSSEFFSQITGNKQQNNISAEIHIGETLEFRYESTALSEQQRKIKRQFSFERRLLAEERQMVENQMNELRVRLYAITRELMSISRSTPKLSTELEIAAMQMPVNPGIYHEVYFEKLLNFLKDFSRGIENSIMWLSATNKRGQKKTFWSLYKQYKGKFLLSGEHFSQRSAG